MNKKVIIITQDIGELPFDIKSYRANEYSLQFNKLPKLIDELRKLLFGAIDNSVKYGNPVSDYILDYYTSRNIEIPSKNAEDDKEKTEKEDCTDSISEDEVEKGFLDYIADIEDNSKEMTREITDMGTEMNEAINTASEEIVRAKTQSGNIDASFVRNVCRKLSTPIDTFAGEIKGHVDAVYRYWAVVENSYLSLLDNKYTQNTDNIESLEKSMQDWEICKMQFMEQMKKLMDLLLC